MSVGVVITALNHGSTLLESIESVLSQNRLPDQFGLALGPSVDATDRMAEFYLEEFDFVHRDRRLSARHHGLAHLRLGSLSYLRTDHILFLAADSYLLPEALDRIETRPSEKLVLGGTNYLDPSNENWSLEPPSGWNPEALLEAGPIPPGSVVWPRSGLIEVFPKVQPLQTGPFTTLAWLLVLHANDWPADLDDAPQIETWDHRVGDYCWTRSVYRSLVSLEDILPERASQDRILHPEGEEHPNSLPRTPSRSSPSADSPPPAYPWFYSGPPLPE